ncbi:MAG: PDZ domain-containing protein [Ignavibacteriales bacterium]|nr:PDZ domain-containing protein [Ignavibacteriales bacterium]
MKHVVSILCLAIVALALAQPSGAQMKRVEIRKSIGQPTGAWLGVGLDNAEEPHAGARVTEVIDNSPADSAGIKEGDVITKFNGRDVKDAEDLVRAVQQQKPGVKVTVEILRGSGTKKLSAVLSSPVRERHTMIEAPEAPSAPVHFALGNEDLLGMKLLELRSQLGKYFDAPNGRGLLIEEVRKKSAAAKAGLQAGDVIIASDDEVIQRRRDLAEILDRLEESDTLSLTVLRHGVKKTVSLTDVEKEHHGFFRNFHFQFPGHDGYMDIEKQLEKIKPQLRRLKIELQGDESEI